MPINLCWWCSKDVEDGIWLDVNGQPVTWKKDVVVKSPAAYHPECAKLYQTACEQRRKRNSDPDPGVIP